MRLTPAGRSAIEAAAPNHVTTVRRFFLDPLSDDELDTLGSKARALGHERLAFGIDVGAVDNQHRAPQRKVEPCGVGRVGDSRGDAG